MCGYIDCLFTICTATKGLQNSCNKDIGKHAGSSFAPAEVIRCFIFSIIGLAMHEPAGMAKSVVGGLKPLFSPLTPTSHPPLSPSAARRVCHQRLTGSSPAMAHLTSVTIPSAPSGSFPSGHGADFFYSNVPGTTASHWMSGKTMGNERAEKIQHVQDTRDGLA